MTRVDVAVDAPRTTSVRVRRRSRGEVVFDLEFRLDGRHFSRRFATAEDAEAYARVLRADGLTYADIWLARREGRLIRHQASTTSSKPEPTIGALVRHERAWRERPGIRAFRELDALRFHLLPYIEDKRVSELTPADLRRARRAMQRDEKHEDDIASAFKALMLLTFLTQEVVDRDARQAEAEAAVDAALTGLGTRGLLLASAFLAAESDVTFFLEGRPRHVPERQRLADVPQVA